MDVFKVPEKTQKPSQSTSLCGSTLLGFDATGLGIAQERSGSGKHPVVETALKNSGEKRLT